MICFVNKKFEDNRQVRDQQFFWSSFLNESYFRPFFKCPCVVWFVWTQYPNYCENNGVCLQATILFCKENFPFLPYSCIKTLNKPAEFFLWCCFLKWITIFQLLPFTFLKSYFLFHYCCSLMRCKFFEKNRCIFLCF